MSEECVSIELFLAASKGTDGGPGAAPTDIVEAAAEGSAIAEGSKSVGEVAIAGEGTSVAVDFVGTWACALIGADILELDESVSDGFGTFESKGSEEEEEEEEDDDDDDESSRASVGVAVGAIVVAGDLGGVCGRETMSGDV